MFYRYSGMGISYYLIDRLDEAIDWLAKAVHDKPEFFPAHAFLIASYHEAGAVDECQASLNNCLQIIPSASLKPIRGMPFRKPEHLQRLLGTLAAARLPSDP